MVRTIFRLPKVREKTGLSTSTIYEKMARGTFPKPIRLSDTRGAVGWLEDEILAWQEHRIAERDAVPARAA